MAAQTGAAALLLLAAASPAARADVPEPAAGTSVVTVRTGGDRTGGLGVVPLAGVRLALYADESDTTPLTDDWAECVSDGDGDCSFVVPATATGGANAGARFWVRQAEVGAPSGWYTNPVLRTGNGSGSVSYPSTYQFRTPALADGRTYSSTSDFMYSTAYGTDPFLASAGVWQNSRVNPELPENCGLDVALVLDLSASVGSALPNLKAAADKFTDALTGTPSRLALFSFDRDSPSTGTTNHPDLTSVSTTAGGTAFKDRYADWTLGSGTNWDQGLNAVAEAAPVYDLVVVLTDGNPTRWGKPYTGNGSKTNFADTEGGIFSANAVKKQGSRVVAVGVGSGVEGDSVLNLRAVSGTEAFTGTNPVTADYYQTDDFAAAGTALHDIALTHCDGTLSVVKQIVPATTTGEDVTGAENAGAGWQFDASTTTSGIGGLPDTETTTDDGTGAVAFEPTYPADTTTADVTVQETQHTDHVLVTQDGKNAVCTDLDDGTAVDVTNSGAAGFTVDVPRSSAVSCVVYNRPTGTADVEVDKTWLVDGEEYAHEDRPEGLEASLTLTGPTGSTPRAQDWGAAREGYTVGDSTTIAETVGVPAHCVLAGSRLVAAGGAAVDHALPHTAELTAEHTTFTVRNTVTCKARLTLVKDVVNAHGGDAGPADWTLTADGPTALSGTSGSHEVTDAVVTAGTYALAESDGPSGYDASDWACRNAEGDAVEVTEGAVDVAAGTAVTCTVTNTERAPATEEPTPTPTDPPATEHPGGGGHGGGHGGGGELADSGGPVLAYALGALCVLAAGVLLTVRRTCRR
ncbi:hypothetical protein ACIPSE_21020 [Streptomyces sp. NPDC090106]|uniref:hypothetical protein n=1 Tax=Streptomyces sp. NPDC090106 TaxID=3365946 RepID=UPI00382A1231